MQRRTRAAKIPARSRAVIAGMLALALLAAVGAEPASAALRYTSPGGSGDPTVCAAANPCGIQDAVENASVIAGDEVLLKAGTYSIGSDSLAPTKTLTLRPAPGAGRPKIQSDGATAIQGFGMLTVRDLRVEAKDTSYVLNLGGGGLVDRTIIVATGFTITASPFTADPCGTALPGCAGRGWGPRSSTGRGPGPSAT